MTSSAGSGPVGAETARTFDGSSPSSHDHAIPASRPDWDAYFLNIAHAVAWRADCRRAKFGAVIVDVEQRIVSTGYNGAPRKEGSCLAGECPRGLMTREEQPSHAEGGHDFSNCISLHAEMNAIAYAGYTPGGTIYIAALDRDRVVSCDMCSKLIRAAGITRVVTQGTEPSSWGPPRISGSPASMDTAESGTPPTGPA